MAINIDIFRSIFVRDLPYRVRTFLTLLNLLGITHRQSNTIQLTEEGAYLFHLIEKEYTQAYLKTLWEACLKEAWPRSIML